MYYTAGVGKKRPAGHMWPATVFSVACGNIQENLQIWNILQLVTVNVSVEANLTWDLLQPMRRLLKVASGTKLFAPSCYRAMVGKQRLASMWLVDMFCVALLA